MRSKRYGFITFESKESVEKALKPGTVHVVDGKVRNNFQIRNYIVVVIKPFFVTRLWMSNEHTRRQTKEGKTFEH